MTSPSKHTGWQPNATQTRIVVCRRCEGRGYFTRHEPLDGRGKDYRTITEPCTCCEGSGRMVSTLSFATYRPKA